MNSLQVVNEALAKPIPPNGIHPADAQRGVYGDYITAQYAMQLANEIFGIDGIEDIFILSDDHIELLKPGLAFGDWVFITTVKVMFVVTDGARFARIGRGVGVAQAPYNSRSSSYEPVKPQQMDTAAKSSLSDAIKNALMRVGRALGAELYFDERTAQVLGYEDMSSRATKYAEEPEPSGAPHGTTDLGESVCEWGWGKDKKFKGMSLKEIYADPDGMGAMKWASTLSDSKGFTKMMGDYYKQMAPKDDAPPADDQKKVKMWFGEDKVADALVAWDKLVTNDAFTDLINKKFGEGIENFGPDHPRFKNHLKRHFHIDSGHELTWEMLQALRTFCVEGSEVAAFGWPAYYAGDRAPTEQTVKKEQAPAPAPVVDRGPEIVIGPQHQQKVPVNIQALAKSAGVENPDEWLWKVLGEKAVGEWKDVHSEIMGKIIAAVKDGKVADVSTAAIMWEVGLGQFAK